MNYFCKEDLERAKSIDLYTYLSNYEPDNLVKISNNNYTTKEHDSLKISNGLWYWFSRSVGGRSALDYLVIVKNMTLVQAVENILKHIGNKNFTTNYVNKENKDIELILPTKNCNNNKVIKYLTDRGIDYEIILECIDNDLIYEDAKHNVVFIGYDSNKKPRYAMIRGTNSSRFMKEAYGSHKAFSFKIDSINNNKTVHLFESAIDLLSFATLLKNDNKEWYNENLLSLAGVYQPSKNINDSKLPLALNYYLNQHPSINKIVLHLDNDNAGELSTLALENILSKKYEVVNENPKIGKDVNDFLCFKLGLRNPKMNEKER